MPGSVKRMAVWYSVPDGKDLGRDLPKEFEGDAVCLRGLSKVEYVEDVQLHYPPSFETIQQALTPKAVRGLVGNGVVNWAFRKSDPEWKFSKSEIADLDPETFDFVVDTILSKTLRIEGNDNGSATESSTEPFPENSDSPTTSSTPE